MMEKMTEKAEFNASTYLARRSRNETALRGAGVYGPEFEHDACGVGFVAAKDGQACRAVVDAAIEALQAIWHRGAVDADGMTGDGAGIHIEIPRDFFIEHIARTGHDDDGGRLAVGMVFLPALTLPRRSDAGVSSSRKFLQMAISSMAGGRCRLTSPHLVTRRARHGQRSSRSCFQCRLTLTRRRLSVIFMLCAAASKRQ